MKLWLQGRGITYRSLAGQMHQSAGTISKKVNKQLMWTENDLVFLSGRFGLSADFILGLKHPRVGEGGELLD
ncbi:XRE family transcriptional regulator [Bifidobacterium mongoliense]|jgi:plasmid maintenance system antidote protein VapI|uniref:XRE family transcriptional regulator n=1 Tax=Bifidobacterium mongoliense TaxID=518643 RepID=UPI0030EE5264